MDFRQHPSLVCVSGFLRSWLSDHHSWVILNHHNFLGKSHLCGCGWALVSEAASSLTVWGQYLASEACVSIRSRRTQKPKAGSPAQERKIRNTQESWRPSLRWESFWKLGRTSFCFHWFLKLEILSEDIIYCLLLLQIPWLYVWTRQHHQFPLIFHSLRAFPRSWCEYGR